MADIIKEEGQKKKEYSDEDLSDIKKESAKFSPGETSLKSHSVNELNLNTELSDATNEAKYDTQQEGKINAKFYSNIQGNQYVYSQVPNELSYSLNFSDSLLKYDNEKTVAAQIKELKNSRIIIIKSHDVDVLEALTKEISENAIFRGLEKEKIRFSRDNLDRNDLNIDYFSKNKKLKNRLYVVELDVDSEKFSDSLFSKSKGNKNSFTSGYERNGIYMIIWVHLPQTIKKLASRSDELCFTPTYIPFLSFVVKQFLGDGAQRFIKKIEEQRRVGLWKKDNEGFYKELVDLIGENNEDKFIDKVQELSKGLDKSDEEKYELKNKVLESKHPEKIIKKGKRISLHLTFVAVYFDTLTLREFTYLVNLLLQDEREQKIKIKVKKGYRLWASDKDHCLEKASLKTLFSEEMNTQIVDFKRKSLRVEFEHFFEEKFSNYVHEKFKYLFKCLFFDLLIIQKDTTDRVNNAFARFFAHVARSDPDYYFDGLLLSYIRDIDKQIVSNSELEETLTLEKFFPGLHKEEFIKGIKEVKDFKKIIFRKVSPLLREVTLLSSLETNTNRFWNALLSDRDDHDLAASLIFSIRHSSSFNKIYWLEQMMYRCNLRVGRNVYSHLTASIFFEGKNDPYYLLNLIKDWFNNPEKSNDAHAARYAICLLTDYCYFLFKDRNFHKYKDLFLVDFPLFSPLTEEDRSEKLSFLIKWIFHTNVSDIYVTHGWYNGTHEEKVAFILIKWYELSLDTEDEANSLLFEDIIQTIFQEASPHQIKKIRLEISKSFQETREELSKLSRAEIRNSSLKKERDNLKALIIKLKSYKS